MLAYCSDVGYSVFCTIIDRNNVTIFLFAVDVRCPASIAAAAEKPNLSFSGILKSRCQLSSEVGGKC